MTQMRPNPRWQQGGRPQGEYARDNILVVWPFWLYFPTRTMHASCSWLSWLASQFCFEDFPSFLPLGFQGMPNAMRQSGPRPALRHLAPAGNAPASRGLPAAAQRVGKVSASQALPLVCEGGGCYWDLTSASKDGCQIWITKGHPEQGAETAPESFLFLAVQCRSGDSRCYSTAVEIQMGCFPLVCNSSLHLCNIYHSKKKKGSIGYGYLFSEYSIQISFIPVNN